MVIGPGGPQPAYIERLRIIQNEDWSWSVRKTNGGIYEDTTNYQKAQFTVRSAFDAGQALFCSTANGRILLGPDRPQWLASTAYALGTQVLPPTRNGYVYQVTTAGTTGGSQPTWPTIIGNTVTNGSVVFTNIGTESEMKLASLQVVLTAADTADLESWGNGVFALDVWNEFDVRTRWVHGNCVLDPHVNHS